MVSPGLQNWSPVPEGNSEQGLDTGAEVLTRLWAGGPANFRRTYFGLNFQPGDVAPNHLHQRCLFEARPLSRLSVQLGRRLIPRWLCLSFFSRMATAFNSMCHI